MVVLIAKKRVSHETVAIVSVVAVKLIRYETVQRTNR